MMRINTFEDFLATYPDLIELPTARAAYHAYRLGRLDGRIELFSEQMAAREIAEFDAEADDEPTGHA